MIYLLAAVLLCSQFSVVHVSASTGEVAGIEEATAYYIKNVASGLYLEYNPSNDNVRVAAFTGAQNQRWAFRLKSNGTYVIIPRGNTEYRLDVHSGNANLNANIDICPATNDTDQQWHGHRNGNGTYKFKSSCSNFTMFLSAVGTTAGSNVVQSTAYPENQRNWTLEKVTKGKMCQLTNKINGDIDTTRCEALVNTYGTTMGYEPYQLTNTTANIGYSLMPHDIWIFNGHGNRSMIGFHDINGSNLGYIVADYGQFRTGNTFAVTNFNFNALKGNRCVLFICCLAGLNDGNYNLVNEVYNKGAKFVLAPTIETYPNYNYLWLEAFLKASLEKKTVAQALAAADVAAPASSSYYYKGNSYQKLNP